MCAFPSRENDATYYSTLKESLWTRTLSSYPSEPSDHGQCHHYGSCTYTLRASSLLPLSASEADTSPSTAEWPINQNITFSLQHPIRPSSHPDWSWSSANQKHSYSRLAIPCNKSQRSVVTSTPEGACRCLPGFRLPLANQTYTSPQLAVRFDRGRWWPLPPLSPCSHPKTRRPTSYHQRRYPNGTSTPRYSYHPAAEATTSCIQSP